MRYKVMVENAPSEPGRPKAPFELPGQRQRTKGDINKWIDDHVTLLGLDWRVGFLVKFRNGPETYEWVKISDGTRVHYPTKWSKA